ncbi:MAG: archaetidylserine decarboxylase [Pseudorhodoplanes sp.]|uniref:archaetidylserine decarboxylase n=1 Tax=Pseudorhodoplanes sp. TaxID=1934341 RepID=UPI003D12ACD9
MTLRRLLDPIGEDINFLLTNRIPRRWATQFIGWLSKVEQPIVRDMSIGIWRLFSDLNLGEAKKARFSSMHDCFTRELKEGARPIDRDPSILVSPCDAIVGACGRVDGDQVLQVKGLPYRLADLVSDPQFERTYRNGRYVTLRLTASMYHRFHAPYDCTVEQVTAISGDTWNVNPIALKRVERLFCRNERAVIRTRLPSGDLITLVPVAAILVASIRLHFLDLTLGMHYRGARTMPCAVRLDKGQEMGWFEHGSTIIVFAPGCFELQHGIREGTTIRVGQPLFRHP